MSKEPIEENGVITNMTETEYLEPQSREQVLACVRADRNKEKSTERE